MTRYLISFAAGAMDFPPDEQPAVAEAAREVTRAAREAGVWVFGAALRGYDSSLVAVDGTVIEGPSPTEHLGGFAVLDVGSYEAATEWAARIAVACRCAQEIRELLPDGAV